MAWDIETSFVMIGEVKQLKISTNLRYRASSMGNSVHQQGRKDLVMRTRV